jgi:hypothetical protein
MQRRSSEPTERRLKGYRDRLVAQTRAREASIRKEGLRQANSQSRRLLSQHAPSDVRAANASGWGERGYATHRTLGDVERPESFIPWPLAHLPRPAAFAPRQNSSLSRELPAGRALSRSRRKSATDLQLLKFQAAVTASRHVLIAAARKARS